MATKSFEIAACAQTLLEYRMLSQVLGDDVEPGARAFPLHEILLCLERHLQDFAQAIADPDAAAEAAPTVERVAVQPRGSGLRALRRTIIDHSAQRLSAGSAPRRPIGAVS